MTTGTKSLLFGVHQFIWHPLTVLLAWIWLYHRLPNWRELICIIIHDWGYFGKANMDDEAGEQHPEFAAKIAGWLFSNPYYRDLCLYHSRHYARLHGVEPSLLCWADKLSVKFDPAWLYIPRALASGELWEYRMISDAAGLCPLIATNFEWYAWVRGFMEKIGKERRGDVVAYVNQLRNQYQQENEGK